MSSPINIPAILIANVMGISILYVVAIANSWRFTDPTGENKCLSVIFFSCVMNCIVDPVCFLADGKAGWFNRVLVIGCNTLLYFGGAVIGFMWIYLVANHLKTKLHPVHRTLLRLCAGVVIILLLTNLFIPLLFTVDANNVYARTGGYWVYTILYGFFVLDGVVLYFRQRRTSGGLKFFPVWAFVIPVICGIGIQGAFYGVSTATPFTTVSIVCVILCLQNEFMLRDKLTGLYNRFYLDTVAKRLLRYPNLQYTAIMLDINGFKEINDLYGHKVGDEALLRLADVLTDAVGRIGETIRYAGDEFIVVVNTQDEACVASIIAKINALLEKCNRNAEIPYRLSVAVGHSPIDLKEVSMDGYVDKIDKLMYDNKRAYYQSHARYDRRKESV